MAKTSDVPTHPVVRATLENAGWHERRVFSFDDWITRLEADSFHVVEPALTWFSTLGGLTITPPAREDASFGSGQFTIDPLWAATGESSRIHCRETTLGQHLTPIGEWSGEYILLVAADRTVFAETTVEVLWMGDSFEDALTRLILADTPPRVVDLTPG